jgi:hypothetical protein
MTLLLSAAASQGCLDSTLKLSKEPVTASVTSSKNARPRRRAWPTDNFETYCFALAAADRQQAGKLCTERRAKQQT